MGKVVNIKAKVNRAFTSSMEVGGITVPLSEQVNCLSEKYVLNSVVVSGQVGISVTCEDLYTGRQWKVCHAFATFVARRTETGKVKLLEKKHGRVWVELG